MFEYEHAEECAITGGRVYRDARLPSLIGSYVYGDFFLLSFGEDESGELHIVGWFDGLIHRLVETPAPTPTPVPGPRIWGLIVLAALLLTTPVLWRLPDRGGPISE